MQRRDADGDQHRHDRRAVLGLDRVRRGAARQRPARAGRHRRDRGRLRDRDPGQRAGDLGFDVVGTPRDDSFEWGRGGTAPALNVNPLEAGDTDADVTVAGGCSAPLLYAYGEAGDDTITGEALALDDYVYANGGAGDDVLTAPRGIVGAIFYGGAGNDVITGSRFEDVLRGDGGRDRILGGAGADNITGGAGADRISGGAGGDFVKVRDDARDSVTCGAGRDRVNTDRRDRVNGCERINRR